MSGAADELGPDWFAISSVAVPGRPVRSKLIVPTGTLVAFAAAVNIATADRYFSEEMRVRMCSFKPS